MIEERELLTVEEIIGDDVPPTGSDRFIPDTDEKVEWLVRKIADKRAYRDRVLENLRSIVNQVNNELDRIMFVYKEDLANYARKKLEGSNRKTLITPNGKLGFRTVKQYVKVVDETAAIEKCLEDGIDAVKTYLDSRAYKEWATQLLESSGEIAPGCEVIPETESFYVSTKVGDIEG